MKGPSRSSSIPTRRSSGRQRRPTGRVWTKTSVWRELKAMANPRARRQMEYFGVNVPKAYGISAPVLHAFSRRIGRNHGLAEQLWASGIHEAKILAALIGQPEKVTPGQMDRWAQDFDAWDVVDATCRYLYAF